MCLSLFHIHESESLSLIDRVCNKIISILIIRSDCEGGRGNAESVVVSEASEKTSEEKAQLLARLAKMGGQPVVPMIPPGSGFVCQEASVAQVSEFLHSQQWV